MNVRGLVRFLSDFDEDIQDTEVVVDLGGVTGGIGRIKSCKFVGGSVVFKVVPATGTLPKSSPKTVSKRGGCPWYLY